MGIAKRTIDENFEYNSKTVINSITHMQNVHIDGVKQSSYKYVDKIKI